jgi:hypothetical protein
MEKLEKDMLKTITLNLQGASAKKQIETTLEWATRMHMCIQQAVPMLFTLMSQITPESKDNITL